MYAIRSYYAENVYLEEYDMITSLEKVAYFIKYHKTEE